MKRLIFDPVRKKRVAHTPEESVRQQLISYLHKDRGYPLSHMSCEYSIITGKMKYRSDLVIFDHNLSPYLLAECKAPGVKITIEVFDQIIRYNRALRVKYLMLTNGAVSYFAGYSPDKDEYEFITEIPEFNGFSQ